MQKRFTSIAALAVVMFLLVPSFAMAAINPSSDNNKRTYTQEELNTRFQQIHSIMRSVFEKKLTEKEALVQLEKINVYPVQGFHTAKPTKDAQGNDSIITLSNPDSAIAMDAPFALKDYTGYWYVGAQYQWNNPAYWQADFPSPWPAQPGIGVAIGGNDGFGVYTSAPINVSSSTFDSYDRYGNRESYTFATSGSSYGEAYEKQDFGWKDASGNYHYNWDSGYMGLYFTPQNVGQQMSVWSSLSHTWNTTDVVITGISWAGIAWQPINGSNEWHIKSDGYTFTTY